MLGSMARLPHPGNPPRQVDAYTTHYGRLLVYARKLTGDRNTAEDLVQEAWCLLERHQPDSVDSPFRYLRSVVHNLFVSHLRRRKREAEVDVPPDTLSETIAADQPTPEEAVISRLEMEHLATIIDTMPPRQAMALRLYHFENRKLREIAAELGVSISFAQALIAKGLATCAEELDRTGPR